MVPGAGTTLPEAKCLRAVCREDVLGTIRLSRESARSKAQSRWLTRWIRTPAELLRSHDQTDVSGRRSDVCSLSYRGTASRKIRGAHRRRPGNDRDLAV